jgi:hypothetical protein
VRGAEGGGVQSCLLTQMGTAQSRPERRQEQKKLGAVEEDPLLIMSGMPYSTPE